MTDHDLSQRAVLGTLLGAHPRMLGVDELVALLSDVPRVREALRVLVDEGSRPNSAIASAFRAASLRRSAPSRFPPGERPLETVSSPR